jgi:hypothetical protein
VQKRRLDSLAPVVKSPPQSPMFCKYLQAKVCLLLSTSFLLHHCVEGGVELRTEGYMV